MNKEFRKKKKEKRAKSKDLLSFFFRLSSKRGFTLLFASLIVSLLLAIGLAILEITLQEYILSSAGRESQFAFYNADTGIECGLYYDNKSVNGRNFATSSDSNNLYTQSDINCDNVTNAATTLEDPPSFDGATTTTTFSVTVNAAGQCPNVNPPGETFLVNIIKYRDQNNIDHTEIQSRGYNTCDTNNPRRVERGLQVDY